MKKIGYIILFSFIIFSCKTSHELVFTENKRKNSNKEDEYGYHSYLFLIFNNSMKNKSLLVKDYKLSDYCSSINDTIYYQGTIKKQLNDRYLKIIPTYNNKEVSISINNDTIVLHKLYFTNYRYVLINKKRFSKKYILTFTNSYPNDLDEKWQKYLKEFYQH